MIATKKQRSWKFAASWLQWLMLCLLLVSSHVVAQNTGTVTYVYTDQQGTPLAETDAKGNITATFEYTPYGTYAPTGTSNPGQVPKGPSYTGHVNDPETNLVYMQERYYDPVSGRFLSVDPVSPESGNVFNFNRYVYVDNNPIVRSDPDGREAACVSQANHCGSFAQGPSAGAQATAGATANAIDQVNDQLVTPIIGFNPVVGEELTTTLKSVSSLLETIASVDKATSITIDAVSSSDVPAPSKVITLSKSAHGEAAQHAEDAIASGHPSVLTIARDGAKANRKASIGGLPKVAGKQLDEYPPAMFQEGGSGASVRAINARDNMSAGACIGNSCRGLPDGAQVQIQIGK